MPDRLNTIGSDVRLPWVLSLTLVVVFAFSSWETSAIYAYNTSISANQLEDTVQTGSLARQLALCYLGVHAIVALARRKHFPLRPRGIFGSSLMAYALIACSSIVWTVDTELTIRAVGRLLSMCLCALVVADQLSLKQIAKLALVVSGVTTVVSVVFETMHSANVLDPAWRFAGVVHPVTQAWNCSIMILSALHLSLSTEENRPLYRLAALAGLVCLLLTKSRVAIAALLISILGYWFIRMARSRRIKVMSVAFPFAGAAILGLTLSSNVQHLSLSLASFGRGAVGVSSVSTLTGRLPLWQECIDVALHRPYFGYGYNSFLSPSIVLGLSGASGWMSSPHSGYIGTFLELGAVGFTVLGVALVLALCRSALASRGDLDYLFTFSVLTWFALNLGTEYLLLASATFPTFLAMVLLVNLAQGRTPNRFICSLPLPPRTSVSDRALSRRFCVYKVEKG